MAKVKRSFFQYSYGKLLLFWTTIAVAVALLFYNGIFSFERRPYFIASRIIENLNANPIDAEGTEEGGYLVKTPGCRIPNMRPFDESVAKFHKKVGEEEGLVCNNGLPAMVEANATAMSLSIVTSSLEAYAIKNLSALACCHKPFWRGVKTKGDLYSAVVMTLNCTGLPETGSVFLDPLLEFVAVECSYEGVPIYKDFFAFVPAAKFRKRALKKDAGRRPMNVLVVGLDSVSRLHLHRQMPKTVAFLRASGASELLGYNKVADNTFPNLMPVLTGLSETELAAACWKPADAFFDRCRFIWDRFGAAGFATYFAEDAAWMGIFNYEKNGFERQPTDYMWGFFDLVLEKNLGNLKTDNANLCAGPRFIYKMLLDNVAAFAEVMDREQVPYFSFIWGASLSHDEMNYPQIGDEYYRAFFEGLRSSGRLNQTALIFMSDHGLRYGDIRTTYQGLMEERLPFVHILLPDWYRTEFPRAAANLQTNTRRLTTPFDLHETLKDLLVPYRLTAQILDGRASGGPKRAYSLFETIPVNRTCADAAITPHWCTCQETAPVSGDDLIVREIARYAVAATNRKLEPHRDLCSTLTLKDILGARMHAPVRRIQAGQKNKLDYTVSYRTEPGDGVFEATVRVEMKRNYYDVTFSLVDTISRLNFYGNQSSCIGDFHLKLYCYCKNYSK